MPLLRSLHRVTISASISFHRPQTVRLSRLVSGCAARSTTMKVWHGHSYSSQNLRLAQTKFDPAGDRDISGRCGRRECTRVLITPHAGQLASAMGHDANPAPSAGSDLGIGDALVGQVERGSGSIGVWESRLGAPDSMNAWRTSITAGLRALQLSRQGTWSTTQRHEPVNRQMLQESVAV